MNLILRLFRKAVPPLCRHDYEMKFPDDRAMVWKFVCCKCGKTVYTIEEATKDIRS